MPVRILIVDDSLVMRAGLRAVLARCSDFAVVGEAADGDEVPSAVATLAPDLVILDIGMARVGGIDAARQLSAAAAAAGSAGGPKILMLSLHCEEQMVAEAFRAGAVGYVVKTGISRDLIPAIRRVMDGGVFVGRGVGVAAADGGAGGLSRLPVVASELMRRLPPAASRLVGLIAEGHSDREAAGHLGLSETATRSLSEWVLSQLSLSTRDELAELARDGAARSALAEI
jgi:DNA-binding NarL/FixJ family response regulator